MTFEEWCLQNGKSVDGHACAIERRKAWDAAQSSARELVEKMREALRMNHLQNAMCYGREYTDTVLWSKTEVSLDEADKFLGGKL